MILWIRVDQPFPNQGYAGSPGNSGIFRENMSGQRHTLVYLISIKMGMKKSFVITISMRTLGNAPILYLALNL